MKRFHLHVGVADLAQAIEFYSTLFGERPTKQKDDYAKWMLEDPRINFAISARTSRVGVDHLGIQVTEEAELSEITQRLKSAELHVYDEGEAVCCYAESQKAWIRDPAGLPWEAYRTMADVDVFSAKIECCEGAAEDDSSSCCG